MTPSNGESKHNPNMVQSGMRYGKRLPEAWVPLYNQPMRTPDRPLRVVSIGAGMSGMNLAYSIYHKYDLINAGIVSDLCIYESNQELGGTWLVNTYPGVACDVPSHIYTFPFEPNPDWSAFYVSGPEILDYFRKTVDKYNLARGVRLGHKVQKATFNERSGTWSLEILAGDGATVVKDECDILISSRGFLSHWEWPHIPGLMTFKGQLCHSAAWNKEFDWSGLRVAVIGNGSSAIQIIPQLVEKAAHVTNFVSFVPTLRDTQVTAQYSTRDIILTIQTPQKIRRPTYITPGLGSGEIGGQEQYFYSDEEKRNFRRNPQSLKQYRKRIQEGSNRAFDAFIKNSSEQDSQRDATVTMMKDKLDNNDELAQKMIPDWEVGCRRATPGPGYLEAFSRSDVSLVTAGIAQVEKDGIRSLDGEFYAFDAIICATGFNVSHRPGWPIVGRDGLTLDDAWKEEPVSYLSICTANFPNFFIFTGPNSPVGHGSLMSILGVSADYICQWIQKIAKEDILFADVKPEVLEEFDAYSDEIMQTLVWSGGCHSWYKNNRTDGKVTAVWAGSALGFMDMVSTIRGEDFNIVYRSKNRFRFMGNGRTKMEFEKDADLAYYIK